MTDQEIMNLDNLLNDYEDNDLVTCVDERYCQEEVTLQVFEMREMLTDLSDNLGYTIESDIDLIKGVRKC